MAEIYGTKKVLGYRFVDIAADLVKTQLPISMLLTSLLGILTPLAAYTNIWAIFALRVAQVFIVIVIFMVIRASCTFYYNCYQQNLLFPFLVREAMVIMVSDHWSQGSS